MTTLCIWIPSLSSPECYFCKSDFLVLISLFGLITILWTSFLYYAHLIFGLESKSFIQSNFSLTLVCTWFLIPDVTFPCANTVKVFCSGFLGFCFLFVCIFIFHLPSLVYHQCYSFLHSGSSCTPVPQSQLCICVIWARARPEPVSHYSGHFRIPGIFLWLCSLVFLSFPAADLICIVINSP